MLNRNKMKKFFKYAIMCIAFCTAVAVVPSCGDDDDPDDIENNNPAKADVDDSRIFGTWEGEFFDTTFILTFSEDGEMTEKVDGETGKYSYSLKNGSLSIKPATSALNSVMGDDITVSFKGNKSMTIKCNLWDMQMTKK